MSNRGLLVLASLLVAAGGCAPNLNGGTIGHVRYGPPDGATCGQELVDATLVADGTSYYEGVIVHACGVQPQTLRIDVTGTEIKRGLRTVSQRPTGMPSSSDRCAGTGSRPAPGGSAVASSVSSGVSAPPGSGAVTGLESDAAGPPAAAALVEAGNTGGHCVVTGERGDVMLKRLQPGSALRVRIWSDVPLDVSTISIMIDHRLVRATVSDAKYDRYLAKTSRTRAVKFMDATPGNTAVGAAPPPRTEVQPPRLSDHAVWVPGYWKKFDGQWQWIGGNWDVPVADVDAGRTATAPSLPPPPKPEPVETARAPTLVWAAGYWSWDGAAWIWTSGRWREAPEVGVRWRSPRWTQRGKIVFVIPGGWIR